MMIASSVRRGWGLAVLLGPLLAAGCTKAPPAQGAKTIEVVVTRPITDEVTDYQDFTGRLDAIKTVDVRARVSGYITKAPFKEGDEVREGELLFEIDPRPYKAALDAAEAQFKAADAQVIVAQANLNLAKVTYDRARAAGSAATALELDQDRIQAQAIAASLGLARANRDKAKADLENARLNMDWTEVRAPLNGRISRRNVDPHNLVNADQTLLTTIVTTNPVYSYFDVDERTYLDLMGTAAGEQGTWFSALSFPVLMRLANEEKFTHAGMVNFLDNRLNSNTGTIRMRAEFKNDKGFLKPGLFVRVRLPLGRPYNAILIPDEALLSDQGRKYVYVVAKDNEGKYRVKYRSVIPGQAIGRENAGQPGRGESAGQAGGSLRVIFTDGEPPQEHKPGLSTGDRVIISGMQRVRPDQEVVPKEEEPPPPPHSSLRKLLSLDKPKGDAKGATAKE
jgi:multidrug efflux system membrane fusion protein